MNCACGNCPYGNCRGNCPYRRGYGRRTCPFCKGYPCQRNCPYRRQNYEAFIPGMNLPFLLFLIIVIMIFLFYYKNKTNL